MLSLLQKELEGSLVHSPQPVESDTPGSPPRHKGNVGHRKLCSNRVCFAFKKIKECFLR